MNRRSFLLTSLLPLVAAKQGLLVPHNINPLCRIMSKRFLVMKARSIGASQLVHAKMVAAYEAMSIRLAKDLYLNA